MEISTNNYMRNLLNRRNNISLAKHYTSENQLKNMAKSSSVKVIRHPAEYSVFQPNVLLGKNTEMNVTEARVYTCILSENHKLEPERLIYEVPYDKISDMTDLEDIQRVAAREISRISDSLQRRVFKLDKEFMKTHFGSNFPISITPFPTLEYRNLSLFVHLHPSFKHILLRIDLGFTKGENQLLLSFKHSVSHRMYWLIRSEQWKFKGNKINFSVDELKKKLGVEGQYDGRFDNFKKFVLEPMQEEFKGSWVDFDYNLIKGGKGAKVISIDFVFKSDWEMEIELNLRTPRRWEKILLDKGIKETDVVRFRISIIQKTEVTSGYIWSDFYVETVYRIAFDEYAKSQKDEKRKNILSFANFLYKALTEGWWIEEVERRRELANKSKAGINQTNMFNDKAARPVQCISFSIDEFRELHKEFKGTSKSKMTLEELAVSFGYTIKNDRVEKTI